MRNLKPILLVEDDNVDAMTVKRALNELKVTNQLTVAANGEEALRRLQDGDGQRPCLVLLDLNMPKMNGIEFLKVVKADDNLRGIPVIVLTTSREEQDIIDSFKLNVAGYMVKPVDYKKFIETIRIIKLYWSLSEMVNWN